MAGHVDPGPVTQPAPLARRRWALDAARPDDDAAVRALLREQSLGGWVRLSLRREPCADWAAQIEGDRRHTAVLRQGERVIGVGQRTVRRVWFNGQVHLVGYLGLLRRDASAHGRVRALVEGFRWLDGTRAADELPFDLTSVVSDNLPALRLLDQTETMRHALMARLGLPRYDRLARWVTLMLPVSPGYGRHLARAARASDLPVIAAMLNEQGRRCQFAPVWDAEDLASAERCRDLRPADFMMIEGRACAAVWDQRGFKQAVVAGYAPWLAQWRDVVNVWRRLRGDPALPAPGSTLAMAYLSHVAVAEGDEAALVDLVRAAMANAAARGIEWLVTGFAEGHPHLATLRRFFRAHRYDSNLYAVTPAAAVESGLSSPTAPVCGDGRRVHVETATL